MSNSNNARRQADVTKLMVSGYDVELQDADLPKLPSPRGEYPVSSPTGGGARGKGLFSAFHVTLPGPKDTPYSEGIFRISVELPENYPYQSPSIGFEKHSIWHPNVCFASGSVCLDVLNSMWTPLFSLTNVFESFLPYLLTHPNPADPLNSEAAMMLSKDAKAYENKCRECVRGMMARKGLPLLTGEEVANADEKPALDADFSAQFADFNKAGRNSTASHTASTAPTLSGSPGPSPVSSVSERGDRYDIDGLLISPLGAHGPIDGPRISQTSQPGSDAGNNSSFDPGLLPQNFGSSSRAESEASFPGGRTSNFSGSGFYSPLEAGSRPGSHPSSHYGDCTGESMDLDSDFGELGLVGLDDADDDMDREFD